MDRAEPRPGDTVRHKNGGTVDHTVTDAWTTSEGIRVELDDRGITYPASSLNIVNSPRSSA